MTACRRVSARLLGFSAPFAPRQQIRRLSLHEYQSQQLLEKYDVPVPSGKVVRTAQDAKKAVEELGGKCIISPQILHSLQKNASSAPISVDTPDQGHQTASTILGSGPNGSQRPPVQQIYVSQALEPTEEWSLAMTIDRENCFPVILVSKTKGTDADSEVMSFPFSISQGITPELLSRVSKHIARDSPPSQASTESLVKILNGLYKIFTDKDGTNLEITRLARTATDGSFTCLSTAFTFDDAAAKRRPDLFALRDVSQDVPEEIEAARYGIVYVRMDGNIGNVVNGAGLAMATNDAIGLYGGKSANFLDAGGQATKQTMLKAFGIIMRDERVTTIFVNIYGGITDGRMIAESIIGAATELGPIKVPVVVRLQGTNSVEGLKLLDEAKLGIHVEANFGEAAKMAVRFATGQ
uniref:ATP-grasp domain-containing protein n=1 Tax=Bionectria ochroleuca TaxID=29856 RepID=A0A8H7NC88_BIOOC